MQPRADLVYDLHADLGEGPIWDVASGRLLFVDVMRGEIHAWNPAADHDTVINVGRPVGAVALGVDGDWIAAAGRAFLRVDPTTGRTETLAEVEVHRTDTRMNDGYVDARGRFWAGTASLKRESGQGTLYRLDPDGRVHTMLAPVTTSNGIDWSPDSTRMYYTDTRTRRVDLFDFDVARGTIANRRVFVDMAAAGETGSPDGLIVDADGAVWVALWKGGGLRRYLPDGTLDRVVHLPVSLTTKCAFGGPRLDELFVTTASSALTPDERAREPHAGGIFRLWPGVTGKPPNRFGIVS